MTIKHLWITMLVLAWTLAASWFGAYVERQYLVPQLVEAQGYAIAAQAGWKQCLDKLELASMWQFKSAGQ